MNPQLAQKTSFVLLGINVSILIGFLGSSVPAFHAGFAATLGLISVLIAIFGLVGLLLVCQAKGLGYVNRFEMVRGFIPAFILLVLFFTFISFGVFIALK